MWHDIKQSDDSDWLKLRAGKVTGSSINKVMANYGKAFGEPAKALAVDLALVAVRGYIEKENYTNQHMVRGHIQEPIARELYETEMFYTVTNGGFYDNGFTGCSPDGLVADDGLIEVKSVIPAVHYKTIKRDDIDPAYKWQCAFNLKESGRDWIDFISYSSEFPEGNQLYICRKTTDDFQEEFEQIQQRVWTFSSLVTSVILSIK